MVIHSNKVELEQAERLFKSVNTLLNLFLVNERRPGAEDGPLDYNPLDFQTLRIIRAEPKLRATDIAKRLGVAPTTLQSALDRLGRKGLLLKVPHPTDGRAKTYELSKEGLRVQQFIHDQDIRNMEAMLALITPEQREHLLPIIERIAEGLRASIVSSS